MAQIILFSQESCQPCKSLKKYLKDNDLDDKVKIYMIGDSDEASILARNYMVRAVPTMIKINDEKEEISRVTGFNLNEIKKFMGV